jgi:hypothetical protein
MEILLVDRCMNPKITISRAVLPEEQNALGVYHLRLGNMRATLSGYAGSVAIDNIFLA